MAPKTVIRYRDVLKHEVNPIIGNIQLDKLRPVHIQHLLAKLREERPDLHCCDRRPLSSPIRPGGRSTGCSTVRLRMRCASN